MAVVITENSNLGLAGYCIERSMSLSYVKET